MRRDFQLALVLYIASLPAGYAMSLAPEHLPFLKLHPDMSWYGSIGITVILLFAATFIAIRGEREAELEGARRRMFPLIGMIASGLVFVGCGAWYFWPARVMESHARASEGAVISDAPKIPPIGSLRFVQATMQVAARVSQERVAAQIQVEMFNDSDEMIYFEAETAGNINGIAFDNNKVKFNGYVPSHQHNYLLSRRIPDIIPDTKAPETPSLKGVYEYDLRYRYASQKEMSRRTAKGILINYWSKIVENKPGTVIVQPLVVNFYGETEE